LSNTPARRFLVRWHIGWLDAERVGYFANRGNMGFLCLVVLGKLPGIYGATACVGRVDLLRGEGPKIGNATIF
jgi:hypothetical protein